MSAANSLTQPSGQTPQAEIERKLTDIRPECPFDEMAMALSGGGFRAAAFSLGAISYLQRAWYGNPSRTLLSHITFMTSTSGGTLTNACFTSRLFRKDFSFINFYHDLKDFMNGDALLNEVFDILDNPARWDETGQRKNTIKGKPAIKVSKSHNLINAFAKAYDKLLFSDPLYPEGNLFGVYFNGADVHLKTVCFNATELNNGISFRFQTNGQDRSIRTVGNYYLHFKDAAVARKLKLSDIAASSSCFPGGFEPMCYPADFIHKGLNDVDLMLDAIDYKNNNPLKQKEVEREPFCLVDGGVVDNQGLYSMMMEDTYRAEHKPKKAFDLMMVCDVGSFYVDGYRSPQPTVSWWGSVNAAALVSVLPVGILILIASLLLIIFTGGFWKSLGILLLLSSAIYSAGYVYFLFQLHSERTAMGKSSWGTVFNKYIGRFYKIRFADLQQMLAQRLQSASMIIGSLFLNQERRQYYDTFYNLPAYKNRVLSCLIYEFSLQHDSQRKANLGTKDSQWWPALSGELSPSAEMQDIATRATAMATTLWFESADKQEMRDAIITCGQFTMCYNLLKHIYRMEVLDEKWQLDHSLQELKERLLLDWNSFLQNAYFYFNKLEQKSS